MFRNSILPLAGIACALVCTVVCVAFIGFELFRAVELLL
jgi:hypothetical protein